MRVGRFSELQENEERIRQLQEERLKRRYEDELGDLDENTDELPGETEAAEDADRSYSAEELQDIWANDPGYVNERAMKRLDDPSMKDSDYLKTGRHAGGLLNYGKDAVENTETDTLLSEGKVLERWGSETGTYLTEPGTDFKDLHLNVSEDKLERQSYEVVKPFWVTESRIAAQPFDEENEGKDKDKEPAVQYHARICVEDLVELGFLKKKEESR